LGGSGSYDPEYQHITIFSGYMLLEESQLFMMAGKCKYSPENNNDPLEPHGVRMFGEQDVLLNL